MAMNRRTVLRYGTAAAAAAATTAAVSGVVASGLASAARLPEPDKRDFDEEYKGKRIKGVHEKANGDNIGKPKKHKITINGRKLSLMEIQIPAAEESAAVITAVISSINHYEPIPLDEKDNADGLKKLAKKAVDAIHDEELTDFAAVDHGH